MLGGALLGALLATIAPFVGIAPFGGGPAAANHPPAMVSNTNTAASQSRPAPKANPAPPPVNNPVFAQNAQRAIQAVESDARVGVEVFDRQTGVVLTNLNETHQFPTMSVVKLLIALEVLYRNGWALPSAATQQDLARMISYSDDAIASNLWGAYGGPDLVTHMAGVIGLRGTEPPPSDDGEWGDTLTTPADMVTLYRYIAERLPAPDRNLIVDAMDNTTLIAADGTKQYFGIPNGLPRSRWAIKQGWGTSGSRAVVNTTGLIGTDDRYVVVVMTSAADGSESALRSAITSGTGKLAELVS
jgi:hypothetical protein